MYNDKRVIVLDLETQKSFAEISRDKLYQLKISVVGIYDSFDAEYHCFEEKELPRLEERLKQCDLLVGFNIIDFDMRVLGPHLLMDTSHLKVLDLMVEFQKVKGHRVSLQSMAQATLNDSKSGTGYDAIQLYRDGRMDDLKKYCLDDVRITKEIFDYGLKEKSVKFFSNRDYMNHEIEIDWSYWLHEDVSNEEAFPTSLF
ncbi:MAG: ribonuclease H-like domain-containing protein [Candidatus Omnitrophica bacterium]|nr:ribonuclease H-like domain-containing protein [Candidatus Omnitrophota bacterium]